MSKLLCCYDSKPGQILRLFVLPLVFTACGDKHVPASMTAIVSYSSAKCLRPWKRVK